MTFPIPRTTTEIKAIRGLLRYYSKFIKDFAKIMRLFAFNLKKDLEIEYDVNFIENLCKF